VFRLHQICKEMLPAPGDQVWQATEAHQAPRKLDGQQSQNVTGTPRHTKADRWAC